MKMRMARDALRERWRCFWALFGHAASAVSVDRGKADLALGRVSFRAPELTRQINPRRITSPEFAEEEMMSLSGAKSQNFFGTAVLVSAVMLCWSAEAAPKNLGYK